MMEKDGYDNITANNWGVLIFDSPSFFRERNKEIFDILESADLLDGILLYDFEGTGIEDRDRLFEKVSKSKSQIENSRTFVEAISLSFINHSTERISSEKNVEKFLEVVIDRAYHNYAKKLTKQKKDNKPYYDKLVMQWSLATGILLWDALFCKGYASIDRAGNIQPNTSLFMSALWSIRRTKEELLFENLVTEDRYEIVLYNFWGDGYMYEILGLNQISIERKTVEEMRAKTRILENIELFGPYFGHCLKNAFEQKDTDKNENPLKKIEELLQDYIRRLRMFGVQEISEGIKNWISVTKDELKVIILQEKINIVYEYCIETLSAQEDFRLISIPPEYFNELRKEQNLIDDCMSVIQGYAQRYIDAINNSEFLHPWTDSLNKLNINYSYLYERMQSMGEVARGIERGSDKQHSIFPIINRSFPYSLFKNSFYNADFSLLMESAKQMTKIYKKKAACVGCVKLMVKEVAEAIDNVEWKYSAAESIFRKGNGKKSYDELYKISEKGSKVRKAFFKEVISICIPHK